MSESTGKERTNEYQTEPGGKFKKGNPGRPKGTENFATKWKKFIEKVAEDNGMSPAEIDEQLYKVAWEKARKGDYQFYRDIQDRVFGKPQQSIDHTTDGQPLNINVVTYNDNGHNNPIQL